MSAIDQAREAGYTDAEIQAHLAPRIAEAQAAGYSQEEIDKHLGIRPVKVADANAALAANVQGRIEKNWAKDALRQMGQTVKDVATVYAPIEATLNVATGMALGFPAYLAAGSVAAVGHYTGLSDNDPKEVATRYANALTYQPKTEAGQRLTNQVMLPLHKLVELSEKAGEAVVDKTGSPAAAAITEATIQMLPAPFISALGKATRGKTPQAGDFRTAAESVADGKADPQAVTELGNKMQDVYERTGIDPDTLHDMARSDPTVLQDLVATNRSAPAAIAPPSFSAVMAAKSAKEAQVREQMSTMNYEEASQAYASAREHNYAVEVQAVGDFLGAEKLAEFRALEGKRRAQDSWLDRNITDEAQDYLNARQLPEDLIGEYRQAVNNFDPTGPVELGRSIAIISKDVDAPDFFNSPDGVTFRNALKFAKDEGWDMEKVLTGMRSRAHEWAGADGAELFARLAKGGTASTQSTPLIASANTTPAQMPLAVPNRVPAAAPPAPPAPPVAGAPPAAPPPVPPGNAQAAVLSRVSVGANTKNPLSIDAIYTAIKDDLYPIAAIEKALNNGAKLEVAESPYSLARLTRGSAGKAEQFLDHGTFDFNTYQTTGPSLREVLKPVNKDLDGMRAYMVARRAEELHTRGIQTDVPAAEAAQVVAAGAAKYGPVFDRLVTYQNEATKYLKDAGLLSDTAYQDILALNKDYVPFQRLMENAGGGVGGSGFQSRNPIKAIKGSDRIIIDPLESIIKNTYIYTALAERNAVGAAFGELVARDPAAAKLLGIEKVKTGMKPIEVSDVELSKALANQGIQATNPQAFTIFRPNAMRPAPNQIRYFENGKPITLELPAEVAEAFNATDRQSAGMLLNILAVPAKTLRAGSVLAPDFMARNVIRDQLTAFAFSKNGYIPVWDMMSGAMSLAKKDVAFQDWLKSGGANATMISMDRAYLQQHILKLNEEAGLMTRAWNVATSPLEVLRITSELMENATRLGEFKRATKNSSGNSNKAVLQDAGFESREVTLDFQRIGAQTRGLNMIAAFMNATLEGLDRTVRAFKDDPIGTTAKAAVSITLPSVLLWYANNSTPERQERWREIPDWQRDLFWIVMTDEHTYRIPKPFDVGVIFGSVPERMLDKFAADKPDAMKNFSKTIGQLLGVNILPTAAVPIAEHATNHSFFTGNPLVPSRLEGILPEYQYHEYTTELTKAVGGVVGAFPGLHTKSVASPIVIDNYVRGWTGSLGAYVTQALDAGLRQAGVLPDPPTPIATLADIPVVKAFVVRYPSASAQSVQDFYEDYGKRKTAYTTFQYLVKNGDPDAAIKEMNLAPGAFARMEGIHDTIGVLNTNIRMVYRNPDIKPLEKRQLIDSMYGQMIETSREGNKAMAEVDKVLGK